MKMNIVLDRMVMFKLVVNLFNVDVVAEVYINSNDEDIIMQLSLSVRKYINCLLFTYTSYSILILLFAKSQKDIKIGLHD
ncbi:hypothetical protein P3L10_014296 [Capsicum annuum]